MIETPLRRFALAAFDAPRRVTMAALVIAGVLLAAVFARLDIETDLDAAVHTPSGALLDRIDRAFGVREQSFLVVEARDGGGSDTLLRFARELERRLADDDLFRDVSYGFGELDQALTQALGAYAPRYASREQRAQLETLYQPEDIDERLARQLARLGLPGLGRSEERMLADPLDLGQFLYPRLASLRGAYRFDPSSPYFLSEDGRALLVRIQGSRPLADSPAVRRTVERIDAAIVGARAVAGGEIDVAAGGGHFLALESEAVVRRDLTVSLSLSMLLVFAAVALTLRHPLAGLFVLPSLGLGLLVGIGAVALLAGQIAALALAGMTIQIGLGVDFAVHLLLRIREHRATGTPLRASVGAAAEEVGPGLVVAACTTAAAFAAFRLSSFDFLADMGTLTAVGILGALGATLLLQPPLTRCWLAQPAAEQAAPRRWGVDRVVSAVLRAPRAVLLVALAAVTAAALALALHPPSTDVDLRDIHARHSAALGAEARMREVFGGSPQPLLLLLEAPDEPALEAKLRRLRGVLEAATAAGTLAGHLSAGALLPDPASERRAIEVLSAHDSAELARRLRDALARHGFAAEAFAPATDATVAAAADRAPLTLERLRRLGLEDWLAPLVAREAGAGGSGGETAFLALATIFPAGSVWGATRREAVAGELEAALTRAGLRAGITGMLAVSSESAAAVLEELASIGALAFAAGALLVALQFRRLGVALFVLLPVTVGCLWTAALFSALGQTLHFMNAAVLPMVVGIGIDDGIHVVCAHERLRRHGATALEAARGALAQTGPAVALTSATTMIAFGSLAISENRGIASIGVLSFLGVGAAFVASVTILPAALATFDRRV